jgi:aminoglycoside phosphotransferase (APT) family kinase protein
VLVPEVFFEDAGDPPFFGMSFVAGECVEPILDQSRDRANHARVRARALDAVDVIAALHRLDPHDLGLGGEPVVGLGDEIDRWTRAFRTVPAEWQGNYEEVAASLHASMPEPMPPVVNHGDFRLGNTLCEGDHLTAVIDWEIWSVGDPAMDLGWFISFTDHENYPGVGREVPGTPTADAVLARYCELTGEDVARLPWFLALGSFKLAAIQAHNRQRHIEGRYHDEFQSLLGPSIDRLLDLTLSRLDI